MATQEDRRKRGLFLILGLVALLLLAAFAANSGIPWLEAWFGGASSSSGTAAADGGAGAGGGAGDEGGAGDGGVGTTASTGSCFLDLICLDASANADGRTANTSVNDEGAQVNE